MKSFLYIFLPVFLFVACHKQVDSDYTHDHQDEESKAMLQGIWMNEDEDYLSMLVRGDSIFFPDKTSQPMEFWIYKDSIYMQGSSISRYKVLLQTPHVFKFSNQSGDEIRLVKTEDTSLTKQFFQPRPYAINIFHTISRDTIGEGGNRKYACSILVEPTSERVVKSALTDDGIEVDNIYLDNVAKVNIASGGKQIYSHNFRKGEFSKYIPSDFMSHAMLQDIQYNSADSSAVYLDAIMS